MASVSEESTAVVLTWLEGKAEHAQLSLARELFSLLDVLDSSAALRRALTDPSRTESDKDALVKELVGGKVSRDAETVLAKLAGGRWADPRDIADALETLAAVTTIIVAENTGAGEGLERLENELFEFAATVADSHELQRALSEPNATVKNRVKLANGVSGNAGETARLLIDQAVANPRGAHPGKLVRRFAALAANRQQRWVADVAVSAALTQEQESRLQTGLNRLYGRELKMIVSREPELMGGIRVKVGDEVIDASVLAKLSQLRRKFTGEAAS